MKIKRLISFLLLFSALMTLTGTAFAATNFADNQSGLAAAVESVVMLTCYDKNGDAIATGSGFCAFESSVIITNFHVIEGASTIMASTEGGMYFDIQYLVAADSQKDVAILRTKARTGLEPLKLGDVSSLGKGSRVVAIGSPLGFVNTISEGLYNGTYYDGSSDYLLFSASISHGSSGGGTLR